MKSMKGQAALEFMMTYGWAILVVLAAIGALSYFGVLDPSRFTPDTCMGSSGFSCDGKPLATDTTLTFTVSNGAGYDISIDNDANMALKNINCTKVSVNFCDRGSTTSGCAGTRDLDDGAATTIYASDCGFSGLNVVKGEFEFTYTNIKSGLPETVLFTLVAKPK